MLFIGREVGMGKNCALGLEYEKKKPCKVIEIKITCQTSKVSVRRCNC